MRTGNPLRSKTLWWEVKGISRRLAAHRQLFTTDIALPRLGCDFRPCIAAESCLANLAVDDMYAPVRPA
jgi:hypothetical protein